MTCSIYLARTPGQCPSATSAPLSSTRRQTSLIPSNTPEIVLKASLPLRTPSRRQFLRPFPEDEGRAECRLREPYRDLGKEQCVEIKAFICRQKPL